eukprot:68000-Chlamydomonas_euryale.AAC.5
MKVWRANRHVGAWLHQPPGRVIRADVPESESQPECKCVTFKIHCGVMCGSSVLAFDNPLQHGATVAGRLTVRYSPTCSLEPQPHLQYGATLQHAAPATLQHAAPATLAAWSHSHTCSMGPQPATLG